MNGLSNSAFVYFCLRPSERTARFFAFDSACSIPFARAFAIPVALGRLSPAGFRNDRPNGDSSRMSHDADPTRVLTWPVTSTIWPRTDHSQYQGIDRSSLRYDSVQLMPLAEQILSSAVLVNEHSFGVLWMWRAWYVSPDAGPVSNTTACAANSMSGGSADTSVIGVRM